MKMYVTYMLLATCTILGGIEKIVTQFSVELNSLVEPDWKGQIRLYHCNRQTSNLDSFSQQKKSLFLTPHPLCVCGWLIRKQHSVFTPVCLSFSTYRTLNFCHFWSPNLWRPPSPTKQFSYNCIHFWHCLCRDCLRSHRLKASSLKTAPLHLRC